MNAPQDLKSVLLSTDEEFSQLAAKHHALQILRGIHTPPPWS